MGLCGALSAPGALTSGCHGAQDAILISDLSTHVHFSYGADMTTITRSDVRPTPRHRAPGDPARPDPLTDYLSPRRTRGELEPVLEQVCHVFRIPVPGYRQPPADFPPRQTGAQNDQEQ